MFISKQLTVAIDFHSIFSMVWKSVATIDSLVNNSFQNIFFCVQQKKEICVICLEQLEGEYDRIFSFGELSL